jgi:hypothetical protein
VGAIVYVKIWLGNLDLRDNGELIAGRISDDLRGEGACGIEDLREDSLNRQIKSLYPLT